jgi:hypothetical protein
VPEIPRPEIRADLFEPGKVILMRMADEYEIESSNLRPKIFQRGRPALHGIAIDQHVDPIRKLDQHHVPFAHREESKNWDHAFLLWPPTVFPLGHRRVNKY